MKKLLSLIIIGAIVLVTTHAQQSDTTQMDTMTIRESSWEYLEPLEPFNQSLTLNQHFTLFYIDQRGNEYSVDCDRDCDTLDIKMGDHFEGRYIKVKLP